MRPPVCNSSAYEIQADPLPFQEAGSRSAVRPYAVNELTLALAGALTEGDRAEFLGCRVTWACVKTDVGIREKQQSRFTVKRQGSRTRFCISTVGCIARNATRNPMSMHESL